MRIRRIRLKNDYKRFHDMTIDLGESPKKIIALVGPNGSGKSSIFDGLLFHANAYNRIGAFDSKDYKYHSMVGKQIDHQSIEIDFDSEQNYSQLRNSKIETKKENTILSFRNSYRFNSNLNITTQTSLQDIKDNAYGATTAVDLDDKMTENYQRLIIYLNKYRKDNDLTDKQTNKAVLGSLNSIFKSCLNLEIVDHGDIMASRGMLYFKKTNQPNEFSFNVLSSGEKEVVDLFLDIYLKKDDYSDTIYLIDEPELHLNTSIQKTVLIEMSKLIPDECQIWIATHSIGFLNALQNELSDISDIIDFDGDFSSKIIELIPIKKTRQNWQKIFKTALEDLTGLLSPKRIIYCEGRIEATASGDEQGLDAEVYNAIFAETYSDSLFVSSGGSTQPDKHASIALLVLNKAFKEVELLLLKDKDINGDGSPTTDDQRNQFIAKNPSVNKMLKRKEIENYLFDYEILNKAYPVDFNDYNAIISDINKDVKGKASDLMLLVGIKTGLNAEKFKKQLAQHITKETEVYKELESIIFN